MPKVLIVDDEKYVCEGLKNILDWESLGFEEVHTVLNGEEAVAVIKSCVPELIISDVRMQIYEKLREGLTCQRKVRL